MFMVITTHANTLHVPGQYTTIQGGINAAVNRDTVLVAPGTYVENINFLGKSIIVMSEQGANFTTIDGNQAGSVVTFESGEDENAVLLGFTVTNGLGGGSYPNYTGGGITCKNSSDPTITNNVITLNSASSSGGGIASLDYSNPIITNNIISMNIASSGGGIYGDDSFLTILDNTITENVATFYGGGIYAYYTGAIVQNNIIKGNRASYKGGGMGILEATHTSYPIWDVIDNIIADNSAETGGGGISIQCDFPPPGHNITNNTITGNQANLGGAIALYLSAYPVITNSILWGNSAPEIYVSEGGGEPTVNYTDIQNGWTGVGNIDEDPLFIYPDQNDYRLQWGSPCIDTGSPDPMYNDPDGTICDLGAYFYDQSMPQRILLTPHDSPIEIPAEGGSFDYTIWLSNIGPIVQQIEVWVDITLPDGVIYGPVVGPVSVSLNPNVTIDRLRTQNVPANAPQGEYSYNSYAIVDADTSADSFTFVKLGIGNVNVSGGWSNTGETLSTLGLTSDQSVPVSSGLFQTYPNPFNPTTMFTYDLPEGTEVNLTVFDVQGREVATLVDGYRLAGSHEVTFDGSNLASGIYFYRLEAGDFNTTGKMVLMK